MILATFSHNDNLQRLGVVKRSEKIIIDLAKAWTERTGTPSIMLTSMLAFMEGGDQARHIAELLLQETQLDMSSVHRLQDIRLLAPIPVPPQIRDFSAFELHMQQAAIGMMRIRQSRLGTNDKLPTPFDIKLPEVFYRQPIYYKANRFNVIGHDDEVRWPSYTSLLDYELEFGIFVAREGRDIPVKRAHEYIFGYTIFNDFSARDAQELEMNLPLGPAKGKDFDTGNAMGPWIVTADEVGDPYELTMIARVNGKEWSRGTSADMIHGFEDMITHVSRDETLHVGEFFGSGTVGGGCGLELDKWLQPGDIVELEVENIGVLRNRIVRNK